MCVILYADVKGKKIFAKNRDRAFGVKCNIYHEIIDGIEIVYLKDEGCGWIEGMNANGFGLINSTLNLKDSSIHRSKGTRKKLQSRRLKALVQKKNKVYNALKKKTKKNIKLLVNKNNKDNTVEGNTLIHTEDGVVKHLENDVDNHYTFRKITESTAVFTNHSKYLSELGYVSGAKGLSSYMRNKLSELQLKNEIKNANKCDNSKCLYNLLLDDVLNVYHSGIDVKDQPYRDRKQFFIEHPEFKRTTRVVRTTGQILMNFTDKVFLYKYDTKNSENNIPKYINKLPKNYVPKIRVIIEKTNKRITPRRESFTRKKLRNIEKKFMEKISKQDVENDRSNTVELKVDKKYRKGLKTIIN